GGAMAPAVQKEVAKVFAPAKLFVMYGATEASARLSYLPPAMLEKKWGSIGKAIPNVDLFVANEKGEKLPPNTTGEIVAKGANMMQGYWRDPEGTAQVLKNGLYYSGDLGTEDDDGFVFVVGRTRDSIKAGGFRGSAKEIEETILEMNEVHEVACIGVDDPVLDEAVKAVVILRENVQPDDSIFKKFLADKLPAYKQPKYYDFRDSLPKNESGKVLKTVLKESMKKD
ncbi:MAG: acyl--CoA ligase, partial [bacterium]|nr:acyl--CoA ligase [bacterium]